MKNRIFAFAASSTLIGALCITGVASAQSVQGETVTEKGGPSHGMLTSGIVTFGLSYGIVATVALSSSVSADQRMVVPVAGPWMALSGRPPCGGLTGHSCDAATTDKVLIATDGVFQAIGAFLIIDAFLNPRETTVTRTERAAPSVVLVPRVGSNGYGLAAIGHF